jgi:peptidoglycan hydrolase-like amidase
MLNEPHITVGIIEGQREVSGYLGGAYTVEGGGPASGPFFARVSDAAVILTQEDGREIGRGTLIRLIGAEGATFRLHNVTIGNRFHWERTEEQTFRGNLILRLNGKGTLAAINEIAVEDYLESVVSSEMNAEAPFEFLKTHAILSRSWLLAALERRSLPGRQAIGESTAGEIVRWYDREDHELFDVCADDHCQRYHGITKITSPQARAAVRETAGMAVTYGGSICDARYSKACGGLTEDFRTAWEDIDVPYLTSVSDATAPFPTLASERDAARFIRSAPDAYCNTHDAGLLEKILPGFDQETTGFFRWRVEYPADELQMILYEKSGFDFGILKEIVPIERGPSGRIRRLRVTGAKMGVIVGKELEIRRWLSRSHLYSSAFVVETSGGSAEAPERFVLHGAGWGHGVGLCQIGAAVMAHKGHTSDAILKHYFRGTEIQRVY